MANVFYLKQGDTHPNIETVLSDDDGAVDLSNADVLFRMSIPTSGNAMLEKAATVVTPQTGDDKGKVYAEFEDGETDVVGNYQVEWVVTFQSGKKATFPRGSGTVFNQVVIQGKVD